MEFWNPLLTEKSWDLLRELNKKPFKFILIGGWAAYLWTGLHKSKDIDIIIYDFKDLEYLKKEYNLRKNDSLKKYEIKFDEIDIDIYVNYYSRLTLPINEIKKQISKIESISVVSPEILLILKQGAEKDRENSIKGNKDRVDIVTLLCFSEINFKKYKRLLENHKLNDFLKRLNKIVSNFRDIQYLDMNAREFKLKKKELLNKIRFN